jgi:hypothetical protein
MFWAERGLRGAVIYRKLSHGTQSEQGERTIERLLSASGNNRSPPTSPKSSPPTPAAIPSPASPDPHGA